MKLKNQEKQKMEREPPKGKDKDVEMDGDKKDPEEGSDMDIDEDEDEDDNAAPPQPKAKTEEKQDAPVVGDEDEALVCYSTIEAPPSLIPTPKYCDITGLEGPYTDPQTKLRYHDKNIFAHIRTLKPSAVQSYLTLRGSGQPLII